MELQFPARYESFLAVKMVPHLSHESREFLEASESHATGVSMQNVSSRAQLARLDG